MNKIHILRLGSLVQNGVGGADAGLIDLIYTFLLQEYGMDVYSHIKINQIGKDLKEVIIKEGKTIHININYPSPGDFDSLSIVEQNKTRLEVVHTALLRIANYDGKLDVHILELIRKKILDQNFSFYFIYRTHVFKKANLKGKIIIHPSWDRFEFYCTIESGDKEVCKVHIYDGILVPIFDDFFSKGKWKNDTLVIYGKMNNIEIHILYQECKVEYINSTMYSKHPRFELYRAGITPEEKEKAHKDWMHSLPPAIAANIRENKN